MTDLAERLAKIEARLAIQDIVARYARTVDSRDVAKLVELFVDDVQLGDGRFGRAALAEQFNATLRNFYRSMHQVVGHVIDLEGPDTAAGTVYCRAEHECGDRWVLVAICYFDRYERRGQDWFFAGRQARSFYHADMEGGPRIPYDIWPGRDASDRRGNLPQRWPSWTQFWADVPQPEIAALTPRP